MALTITRIGITHLLKNCKQPINVINNRLLSTEGRELSTEGRELSTKGRELSTSAPIYNTTDDSNNTESIEYAFKDKLYKIDGINRNQYMEFFNKNTQFKFSETAQQLTMLVAGKPELLDQIPEKQQYLSICSIAVMSNPKAINYIKNPIMKKLIEHICNHEYILTNEHTCNTLLKELLLFDQVLTPSNANISEKKNYRDKKFRYMTPTIAMDNDIHVALALVLGIKTVLIKCYNKDNYLVCPNPSHKDLVNMYEKLDKDGYFSDRVVYNVLEEDINSPNVWNYDISIRKI